MLDTLKHQHGFVERGLVYRYGLESALKRGILLDIFSVLVQRGSADNSYLASRKSGLENIRRVDAALGVTRTDDIMHLVYNENDISRRLDLAYKSKYPCLKLTSELSSRNERRKIDQIYLLILELVGDVPLGYSLRECLGDGRFTHTWLAYKTGVVLLSAAKYLDNAGKLSISAHYPVKLPLGSSASKVLAIGVKIFIFLLVLLVTLLHFFASGCVRAVIFSGRYESLTRIFKKLGERNSGSAAVLTLVLSGRDKSAFLKIAVYITFHIFKQLGRYPHFLHSVTEHSFHGDSQLLCALHAKPLGNLISVFDLSDENHRNSFAAL